MARTLLSAFSVASHDNKNSTELDSFEGRYSANPSPPCRIYHAYVVEESWSLRNNEPLPDGTSRKRLLRPREKEQSPICRKKFARRWESRRRKWRGANV